MTQKEEFSGKELYDLLGGANVENAIVELSKLADRFPKSGFDSAIKTLDIYRKYKNKSTPEKYVEGVAEMVYIILDNWFDTKWLITGIEDESLVIRRVTEIITDMICRYRRLAPEDFVITYTLLYELEDYISGLSTKEKDVGYKVARGQRLKSAKKGLEQAGITKGFVSTNSPTTVYKKVTENSKPEGGVYDRLQVIDEVAEDIQDALWIDTAIEEDVTRVYVDVYRLYNPPTTSKNFMPTIHRLNKFIKERKEQDEGFQIEGTVFREEQLVVYRTNNNWVVLGGKLRVFEESGEVSKKVFSKALYELRVKDIEKVVLNIK